MVGTTNEGRNEGSQRSRKWSERHSERAGGLRSTVDGMTQTRKLLARPIFLAGIRAKADPRPDPRQFDGSSSFPGLCDGACSCKHVCMALLGRSEAFGSVGCTDRRQLGHGKAALSTAGSDSVRQRLLTTPGLPSEATWISRGEHPCWLQLSLQIGFACTSVRHEGCFCAS